MSDDIKLPELLPCPFCGPGESVVGVYFDDVAQRFRVGCGRCGCSTGVSPRDKTEATAIATWNTRAANDTIADLRMHIAAFESVQSDDLDRATDQVIASQKLSDWLKREADIEGGMDISDPVAEANLRLASSIVRAYEDAPECMIECLHLQVGREHDRDALNSIVKGHKVVKLVVIE